MITSEGSAFRAIYHSYIPHPQLVRGVLTSSAVRVHLAKYSYKVVKTKLVTMGSRVDKGVELRKTMRRYKVIKELGDGTYGSVSLARSVDSGDLMAIKRYSRFHR